jgi:anti-sigma B factor antagonist
MRQTAAPLAPASPGIADAPYFACSSHSGGRSAAWVQPSGELDIAAVPHLERILDAEQVRSHLVVLDLHDLTFIDISGVHAIVEAAGYARIAGDRLIVLRAPPHVQALFDLTGNAAAVDSQRLGLVSSPRDEA